MSEADEPEAGQREEGDAAEPAAAATDLVEAESETPASTGPTAAKRRLRPPTLGEAVALVTLVSGIAGLVFLFAPGCEPQPPPNVAKATISNVRVTTGVPFRRYVQRQQGQIPPGLSDQFLDRRGALVEFDWEIVGMRGKHLPFGWELSDLATNELVRSELTSYELTPSTNDDSGTWPIWIAAPPPGRTYYATVTIYKPDGPPYELKHFPTPRFKGFASR
jgi:hypothetical protein